MSEALAVGGRPDPMAGYGASNRPGKARWHALLELIERDSLRAWWAGTLPPSRPSLDAWAAFVEAQESWGTLPSRTDALLSVARSGLPPVLVAWSVDDSGRGFVFGAACCVSDAVAARTALRELRQMEAGLSLVSRHAAAGGRITQSDRMRLHRAATLDTRRDPRLYPLAAPLPVWAIASSEALEARMEEAGLASRTVSLTENGAAIEVVCAARRNAADRVRDDPYCALVEPNGPGA